MYNNGIISLILTLAIIGVVVWLVTVFLPMPALIQSVIWIVAVVACLIILLRFLFGVARGGPPI